MVFLRDLSVFWCMIHVIFLFVMLFRSRYTRKKTIVLAVTGMGILMALNFLGLLKFGIEALGRVFLFTCSIPSFVFFYVLSADKKFKFLFTFCLADTVCMWVMAVTNLVDFYLGGEQYILLFITRLLAFPILEYCAYRFLRKPYFELQDAVEKGWGIFAGMTMLYYILLFLVVNYPVNITSRPEDVFLCILVLILMVFNYATIFFAFYQQLLVYRKLQSERLLQEQNYSLEIQMENQQRIRKMKHDMKAHTATLSGLLSAGKTEEALNYVQQVNSEMDTFSGQFCTNPYINAVLVQKFQELGIGLKMNVQIGEEALPHMELCQILSNGLENICDALETLPKEKRKASLQIKYSRDYLIIRMKNSCPEDLYVEKGTLPATSKPDADHGFGLFTVKEAAERLDGDMKCYTEKGNFVLDVMIRMKYL